MPTRSTTSASLTLAFLAGCTSPAVTDSRTAVTEPNSLGATVIETERSMENGDSILELRGLGAGDRELASIRVRNGEIDDLLQWLPGDDKLGTEILTSVGANQTRQVTREAELIRLAPTGAVIRSFLELAPVASVLEHEANIVLVPLADASESSYQTASCAASQLLSSPVAHECCTVVGITGTRFINPAGAIVDRTHNHLNTSCKASDGMTACNGAACYFGPTGYGRPTVTTGTGYAYIYVEAAFGNTACGGIFTTTKQTSVFGDVTGTAPRGQGCPGGSSGAGDWDYN